MKRKAGKAGTQKGRNIPSDSQVHFFHRRLARPLSPRELQVLTALGEGKSTPEIRLDLKVTAKAVGVYCARLKKKLELGNMNQLVRAAVLLHEGIIPIAPNLPDDRPFRLCPGCQRLFSDKSPKRDIGALAGYRVLAAVLNKT